MNRERMTILAQNAAKAMFDRSLNHEERGNITNPPEIDQLSQSDYEVYRDMMITFMRELRNTPQSSDAYDERNLE